MPSHLATIVPAAPVGIGVEAPFFRGIADPYEEQWAVFTGGKTSNDRIFNDSSFWISKYREMYLNHIPFRDLGKLVGYPSEWFQICVRHPKVDDYCSAMMPNAEQYKKISIPILTITGDYDGDQPGALYYYGMRMKYGSTENERKTLSDYWPLGSRRNPNSEEGIWWTKVWRCEHVGSQQNPPRMVRLDGTNADGGRPPKVEASAAFNA